MPPSPSAPLIVVAPDSFKGSLSAPQASDAIARGILRAIPSADIRRCPMADGGEGTLDAVLSVHGTRDSIHIANAAGIPTTSAIGQLDSATGLIEVAQIVGLTDRNGTSLPVTHRTTSGVGEAILALLDRGCNKIFVALGGSSTNDAGAGLLTALGVRLLDKQGKPITPLPENFAQVSTIDISGIDPRLAHCELIGMSDVDNPLTGSRGATFVFGPQKGVAQHDLRHLDSSLTAFASKIEDAFSRRCATLPGAGAAGGLGFAIMALGGTLVSGAGMVADLLRLDSLFANADWVITGEGRTDEQTLSGKAPMIVAQRARNYGVPVTLLSGSVEVSALALANEHFSSCFSLVPGPMSLERAIQDAETLLASQAEQLARLWMLSPSRPQWKT